MAVKRGTKIHIEATPEDRGIVAAEDTTVSLCGRPVWVSIAMSEKLLMEWVEDGMSTGLLCAACLSRSIINIEMAVA